MRKIVGSIAAVWLLSCASSAFGLTAFAELYGGFVRGQEATAGQPVKATLKNRLGRTKGVCRTTVGSNNEFRCEFSLRVLVQPGDRVSLRIGSTTLTSMTFPNLFVTTADPRTDVVRGRIVPRKAKVMVHVSQRYLASTGREEREFLRNVSTAADGRFSTDLTSGINLKRLDQVHVGYQSGDFIVYRTATVPGLMILTDSNFGYLQGPVGSQYRLRLLTSRGVRRSECQSIVGGMGEGGAGIYAFYTPGGLPLRIYAGNRVQVDGKWGFTSVVQRLTVSLNLAADTVRVKALPSTWIMISFQSWDGSWYKADTYLKTDSAGVATVNLAGDGIDLRDGDSVGVSYIDREGNELRVGRRVAPY